MEGYSNQAQPIKGKTTDGERSEQQEMSSNVGNAGHRKNEMMRVRRVVSGAEEGFVHCVA